MDPSKQPQSDHSTRELQYLFKHLLLYILVLGCLKILNMIIFPGIMWSQVFLVLWTILLALHLLLFFFSTGIFGSEYENRPVADIADELWDMVKARNRIFRESISRGKSPGTEV